MGRLEKIIIVCIIIFLIIIGKTVLEPGIYQGVIPEPIQNELINPESVYVANGEAEVKVDLLAEYEIEAVVKSKKKYSDYPSDISEYDLALAWGDLNKNDIDEHIKYTQSGRWYYFTCDNECPVSVSYVGERSANVHLIHKDEETLKEIKRLDVDDHIKLVGYLVRVNFDNGPWTSSLKRSDTGDGACEVMYVTDVELLD